VTAPASNHQRESSHVIWHFKLAKKRCSSHAHQDLIRFRIVF
jgi:hypothetical protein